MLNRIILIGRLTRDPELRYTPAGVAVTQFTLAVDRNFTGQNGEREADFIPVVAWRQLAETCANYLRKGRLTAVEGRIQVRNYENNEGKRVYVTEVIADNVRLWNLRKTVKAEIHQVMQVFLKNQPMVVAVVTVGAETAIIFRVTTTIIKILFRAMENRSIYRTMICHFNKEGLN